MSEIKGRDLTNIATAQAGSFDKDIYKSMYSKATKYILSFFAC